MFSYIPIAFGPTGIGSTQSTDPKNYSNTKHKEDRTTRYRNMAIRNISRLRQAAILDLANRK